MSNDVRLSTFPSSKISALTMLYLEKQDLKDLTPTQLAEKYNSVYSDIEDFFKQKKSSKQTKFYDR